MEMEEKIEKLVSKCFEKDKFIQRVGSVLRGCRCGIVSASLLDELAQAESQLEKPDYQQLISPHTNATSHVRLQGDTISSAWSSLGTISSQLLNKEEQSNQQASTSLSTSQQLQDTQYVQVAESRAYPVSESAIAASYVEEDLSAPRYVSEVVVSMPQSEQYESRMVISQIDHQYHGSVQDRGDGSTETEQRSLLNNFTELTYENFVENVSYPPESPESNSEIYTLNNPVITHLLEKPRLDAASDPDAKVKNSLQKARRKSQQSERDGNGFKHICKTCGKGYVKLSKLVQHQRSHNGEKPFRCKICRKGFAQGGTLRYHLRIHSGEKPFTCSECGKKFAQPGHLTSHILVHMKKFKCDLCPKHFTNEIILEQHKKSHTKVEYTTKCDHCRKDFRCHKNLVKHVRKYCVKLHGIKCQKCGKVCADEEELNKHKQEHFETKPHQCDICLKQFTRPAMLEAHKLRYRNDCDKGNFALKGTKKESLKCEDCGMYFAHRRSLVRHVRKYCEGGSKRKKEQIAEGGDDGLDYEVHVNDLECEELHGKNLENNAKDKVGSSEDLDVQDEVEKQNLCQCKICHKIFSHPGKLETHMLHHFECPDCGVFCSSFEDLDKHGEVHSKKKPHKCEICLRRFMRPGRLVAHKLSYLEGHKKGKPHFPGNTKAVIHDQGCIETLPKGTAKKKPDPKGKRSIKAKVDIEDAVKEKLVSMKVEPNLEDCTKEKSDCEETSDYCISKQVNSNLQQKTDSDQHVMEDSRNMSLNCDICPKSFMQLGKLMAHRLSHEVQQKKRTHFSHTSKEKSEIEQLNRQVSTSENPDQEDSVKEKEVIFKDKPDPEANTKERLHMCELCGKCFTNKYRLKNHMRTHTGEKPYMCDLCGKFFTCSTNLKRHHLSHSGDKKFKCAQCNKMFVTLHNLQYHLQVHNRHKEFRCDVCGRSFSYSVNLDQHMLTHKYSEQEERVETNELESKIESQDTERKEEGNKLNYRCKFCEVGFEKASDLFQHQRSHEDDDQDKQGKKDKKGKKNKKSMCNICDKPFAYESNLKYHMRIHTGEKPFKCHECGKCFTQSGQLTSHSLVHLKKFKCSLCTRYFTEEIILVQHMKIHRKDYPVTCGKCGEVCYDKEQLKRHKKEHPKEKVLECHICPRRFAYQSKLKEHKVKRHGYDDGKPKQEVQKNEKQVMCGKCGKKFATRYTFRRHTNRCFVQDNSIVQQDVEVHTTFEKSFLDSGGLPSEGLNLEDCMITLDVQSSFSEKPKSSTEGKSKECELCNKVLCNAYSLKKHMLTHTGEKPYMCDLCGKCFTSSYVLKEHCLSHAGIKNFKCEQCDKSFLNVRKLQIHFQTHNRPKTFTCKICSRTLSAGTFDRHMNIHMRTGHIVFPPSNTSMS